MSAAQVTPRIHHQLVRLGTSLPFAEAAELLLLGSGVQLDAATLRRQTEAAGRSALAVEALASEPLTVPEKLCYEVDGVMVPLIGGQWAEVKMVAIGAVGERAAEATASAAVPTSQWSYFARLLAAEPFSVAATPELTRRGLFQSARVAAINDGAEWIEGFHAYHLPQVRRILDFPHAAQRLSSLAEGLPAATTGTTDQWRQQLRREGATPLLDEIAQQLREHNGSEAQWEHYHYLDKRRSQLDYPAFMAEGWPIASGAVEGGNKAVVQARLKRSGMHWARPNVDPMLALRTTAASGRWATNWPQIVRHLRLESLYQRRARQRARQAARPAPLPPSPAPPPSSAEGSLASPPSLPPPAASTLSPASPRPPDAHPWRRFPACSPPSRSRSSL